MVTNPFLAMALLGCTSGAHAQSRNCGPYEKMEEFLSEKHNEAVISQGLAANGMALQIFSSPKGETWTVVALSPTGTACMIATGTHWIKNTGAISKLRGPKI